LSGESVRIAVVAPSTRFAPEAAERVQRIGAAMDPAPQITFHPQCFASSGHFAGEDATRAAALIEVAESDAFDAVWFARGGYGAGRLLELVMPALGPAARRKTYLGYSDAGALLGAFYQAGFPHLAHGPVAQDVLREGGEAAVIRALTWLATRDPATLEPSLGANPRPAAAFNLSILSTLIGTPWQPDLTGHVLMVEDVGEYMYRLDRLFFHVTSNPGIRRIAGLRLGRCSDIPVNEIDFGMTEEEVARFWCERAGIPWLGRADIGHDAANKIVPFGLRS
jgi:muramoyltetrapeptide carboxypeptidase